MDILLAQATLTRFYNGEPVSEEKLYKAAEILEFDPEDTIREARFYNILDSYLSRGGEMTESEKAYFSTASGSSYSTLQKTASINKLSEEELLVKTLFNNYFVPDLMKLAELDAGQPQGTVQQNPQYRELIQNNPDLIGQMISQGRNGELLAQPSPTAPQQLPSSQNGNYEQLLYNDANKELIQAQQEEQVRQQMMQQTQQQPQAGSKEEIASIYNQMSSIEKAQHAVPYCQPEKFEELASRIDQVEQQAGAKIIDPKQITKIYDEMAKLETKKIDEAIKTISQEAQQAVGPQQQFGPLPQRFNNGGQAQQAPQQSSQPQTQPQAQQKLAWPSKKTLKTSGKVGLSAAGIAAGTTLAGIGAHYLYGKYQDREKNKEATLGSAAIGGLFAAGANPEEAGSSFLKGALAGGIGGMVGKALKINPINRGVIAGVGGHIVGAPNENIKMAGLKEEIGKLGLDPSKVIPALTAAGYAGYKGLKHLFKGKTLVDRVGENVKGLAVGTGKSLAGGLVGAGSGALMGGGSQLVNPVNAGIGAFKEEDTAGNAWRRGVQGGALGGALIGGLSGLAKGPMGITAHHTLPAAMGAGTLSAAFGEGRDIRDNIPQIKKKASFKKEDLKKQAWSWQGFKEGLVDEGIPLTGATIGAGLGYMKGSPLRGAALGYALGGGASLLKSKLKGEEFSPGQAMLAGGALGYGLGGLSHGALESLTHNRALANPTGMAAKLLHPKIIKDEALSKGMRFARGAAEEALPALGATAGTAVATGLMHRDKQKTAGIIDYIRTKNQSNQLHPSHFDYIKSAPEKLFKAHIKYDKKMTQNYRDLANQKQYIRNPKLFLAKSAGKDLGKAGLGAMALYGTYKALSDESEKTANKKLKRLTSTIDAYPDDPEDRIMMMAKKQDKERCYSVGN